MEGITIAEICLDCWNKINGTDDPPSKYILSEGLDLCEVCGECKNGMIVERKCYYMRKFRWILSPIKVICAAFYVLWRVLILPYLVYQYYKTKKDHDRK